jgi:hypothetical protein
MMPFATVVLRAALDGKPVHDASPEAPASRVYRDYRFD